MVVVKQTLVEDLKWDCEDCNDAFGCNCTGVFGLVLEERLKV